MRPLGPSSYGSTTTRVSSSTKKNRNSTHRNEHRASLRAEFLSAVSSRTMKVRPTKNTVKETLTMIWVEHLITSRPP